MTTIVLKKRETTSKGVTRRTRRAGEVPGVIYGEAVASRHFSLAESAVKKLLQSEGKSGLFDVQFEGDSKSIKAILHDWQNDEISGRPRHIDLYQVRMDKVLHTEIPIHFIGVSSAVKDLGGTLIKQANALPIECLPGDLVHNVEVSIEPLKTFNDFIRVKDLVLPAAIKVLLEPDTIIANVFAPRTDAEMESLKGEVKADVAAVEVITEKKEETAEGEDAAAEEKK
ncbi:MAG: 50S ribosomal protein L25 [Candidatus Komeilibacteria bacterium]|nr:50S ribosomal protein L25 [Candidatus Komeilibacteria bacterium]